MNIKDTKAYKYALWCVNDDTGKVGRYVKLQCEQWLELVESGKVSDKMVDKVYKLLKLMICPDTQKDMNVSLADYSQLLIYAVFCTFKDVEHTKRYYSLAVLEIARKNRKTFTSAVIFIIMMLTEKRFSRLFSVAPDYKLSSELRLAVRKIILSSSMLQKHFKITRDMVTCKLTDIEYTPLAYSNDKMDGRLANCFLADEDGAMDSYPVEAMSSSQIDIDNSLGIIISTQYPNENNDFKQRIDYCKRILDKVDGVVNVGTFALLYEPDSELVNSWTDDINVIYQANPVAVGNDRMIENLLQKRSMAILYEDNKENYLCKHCNIQYKGVGREEYISVERVKECAIDSYDWRGRDVYIAFDLSQTTDNTSVTFATYDVDSDTIIAQSMGFIPADSVDIKSTKEKYDYKLAIKENWCISCGDEVIDYNVVESYILKLSEEYGINPILCGYDRYNAISTVQKLERAEQPIQCVEIIQHSKFLHSPTKELKERVLNHKFKYIKNGMLENNFSNARCVYDTNMNSYVNKKKSTGKVDMVVSLIMCIYLIEQNELMLQQQVEVYI